MSQVLHERGLDTGRFPRVSGDEPMPRPAQEQLNGFSPRERG